MTTRKLSTFRIGNDLFGIPVEDVQEVTRSYEVTPVPLAPESVTGLMNLRGQVVTVVDLRRRLGYPARDGAASASNVVVRPAAGEVTGGAVSLLVDHVEGFVDVADEQFAERPESVTGPAREMVTGAYQLPGRLLLALDLRRAVAVGGAA